MGWLRRDEPCLAAQCRCSACEACRLTFGILSPRPTGDVGPSLGMKKSSSLESLQTMVHEVSNSMCVRG